MIVDSHCHLDYPKTYEQLDDILKRADSKSIKLFLTICTNLKSIEKIKLIIEKYKNVYGTFGIHPHDTKDHININSSYIIDQKKLHKKIIGIGESGLDYYYNNSDKLTQKKIFIEHIKAASELNVPIIVHTRNAEQDTYEILKKEKENSNLKVLIHCFTGTKSFAKKLIDLGCYISVSGIVTFKNANELTDAISYIPLESLLVETDSPFLAPEPYRGRQNEPANIIYTIKKLSEIKNVTTQDIITNTTRNFKKIFAIK